MSQQQSLTDEQFEGTVDHIKYGPTDDDGYAVAQLQSGTTIVGTMPGIRAGADVTVVGEWTEHSKYGSQFQVSSFTAEQPTDADGLASWLERIDDVGNVYAHDIVDGLENLEDVTADDIRQVDTVPSRIAEAAAEAWQREQERRDVLIALQGYGLTSTQADKAWKKWGQSAPATVEENPYRLTDLSQIGFKTADGLARDQFGIDHDATIRIKAGLEYTLKQSRQDGNVGLPAETLIAQSADRTGVRASKVRDPFEEMIADGSLVAEYDLVFRPRDANDEQRIATRIREIEASRDAPLSFPEADEWIDSYADTLTDEQRRAFRSVLAKGGVATLTGGPGTGKTYTLDAICRAWRETHRSIHLAAPTGRAAKRIEDVTGKNAQTIHRLLEFMPGRGFVRQWKSIGGLVVIDETSMLDTPLAARLFERIADDATVLLVGDPDQLPSVGAGYVFGDILEADVGTSVHLTKIHRQAQGSGIVTTAYKVNRGEVPSLRNDHDDLGTVRVQGSVHAQRAVEATAHRLDELGYDLREDVQILAPMYNSEAGVDDLNQMLQYLAHDGNTSAARDGRKFGGTLMIPGDRVMQTTNNYDLGVYNGDVGTVDAVAGEDEYLAPVDELDDHDGLEAVLAGGDDDDRDISVRVDFPDGRTVGYTAFEAASELELAYACTIHKAQGSEYPVAVVVLTSSHWIMCERTLLYTAITRAADFGVLIAEPRALERACEHHSPVDRHRALAERLENTGGRS